MITICVYFPNYRFWFCFQSNWMQLSIYKHIRWRDWLSDLHDRSMVIRCRSVRPGVRLSDFWRSVTAVDIYPGSANTAGKQLNEFSEIRRSLAMWRWLSTQRPTAAIMASLTGIGPIEPVTMCWHSFVTRMEHNVLSIQGWSLPGEKQSSQRQQWPGVGCWLPTSRAFPAAKRTCGHRDCLFITHSAIDFDSITNSQKEVMAFHALSLRNMVWARPESDRSLPPIAATRTRCKLPSRTDFHGRRGRCAFSCHFWKRIIA